MINVKEDIIDKALLDKCVNFVNEGNWSYGWHSNKNVQFGHWNLDITKTSANNSTDVVDRLPKQFKPVWDIINKEFFGGKAMLTRCYSNRHTFGTEGYIHTDTTRAQDHTCVVYLDEEWDSDWGGETNFYTADKTEIIKSVLPKYGRTAVFPGTVPHCARGITRICSKVRTTLMFKATIDPKALYPAEEMLKTFLTQIGATQRKHRTGTLADHLMRCFHLLKDVGANDILALAGGLHSVYGTNAFKHPCVDKESTQVAELFGPEVDRLVKLYSEIDRPSCLENPDGSLSELDLFLLRSIECVNLHDQDALKADKYPNLLKFVKQLTGRG
jgi:SM-20-related protein